MFIPRDKLAINPLNHSEPLGPHFRYTSGYISCSTHAKWLENVLFHKILKTASNGTDQVLHPVYARAVDKALSRLKKQRNGKRYDQILCIRRNTKIVLGEELLDEFILRSTSKMEKSDWIARLPGNEFRI